MLQTPSDTLFRRRFPRRQFARGAGLLYLGSYEVCTGSELGEGGVSMTSNRIIQIGEQVVVSFQIPRAGFVILRAEIRNQKSMGSGQYLYGCSFLNLPFEIKREIRNFVTTRRILE